MLVIEEREQPLSRGERGVFAALDAAGYVTMRVRSAEQASRILDRLRPDLLVVDVARWPDPAVTPRGVTLALRARRLLGVPALVVRRPEQARAVPGELAQLDAPWDAATLAAVVARLVGAPSPAPETTGMAEAVSAPEAACAGSPSLAVISDAGVGQPTD